jgi:hypothetical protein
LRVYLYKPRTTKFFGGSIGIGVPLPRVLKRKNECNITNKPIINNKIPNNCNKELLTTGRFSLLLNNIDEPDRI